MSIYKNTNKKEVYNPTDEEQKFMNQAYTDFVNDYNIKEQTWDVLNERTLETFWSESNYDYNQIVSLTDETNPVTPYSSGISRDKSNVFISNLSSQLAIPSVAAQNREQEIDFVVSKVGRSLLEWQFDNDGRPAESGYVKNFRAIHRQVTEGTLHVLDMVDEKGRLTSEVIDNEEIFIPNFYQPNIQLQSHVFRVQQYIPYYEAEMEFGNLPNWKYVVEGQQSKWLTEIEEYKEWYKAIYIPEGVSIIRIWYNVSQEDLERLKKEKKLPRTVKKAKWYNVIINGVLMFDAENLMPYHHGYYPINKGIFESFSPSTFYWGNSMPNKAAQDKSFLDSWKTLVRYKAKLSAIPPLLNFTGQKIDQDVIVPGLTSDMPTGTNKDQISAIPGISNGISNGDIFVMRDATEDIDRSTAAPQLSGQQTGSKQTARETMIIEANAQKAMAQFAQQVAFLAESRSFPILKSTFQFLPRDAIKKISIPSQIFEDGKEGILEIVFENLKDLKAQEGKEFDNLELSESFKIMDEEERSEAKGFVKRKVKVNKEYINNLEFYCKAVADSLPRETKALREARANLKFETYSSRPDLFNIKKAARQFVREVGDSEDIIQEQAVEPTAATPATPVSSPDNTLKRATTAQQANLITETL